MKHIKKVKPKSTENTSSANEKNGKTNPIRYARPCIPVDGE